MTLKKCVECRNTIPDDIPYCVYCGNPISNLNVFARNSRLIFALSPLFIILICLSIAKDLESSLIIESGLGISSLALAFYFIGALIFGIFKIIFKLSSTTESYLIASYSSLFNGLLSIFAVFAIENLFFEDILISAGPTSIIKKHILIFLAVFSPIQFIETILISLKAKLLLSKVSINKTKHKIFSNLYLIIPILFLAITVSGIYYTSTQSKITLISEFLIAISSKTKANNLINKSLEEYPNDSKLCSLKAVLLTNTDDNDTFLQENNKQCLELAEKASNQKPNSPLYKYYLSLQLEINGNYEKAIKIASEAASLANNDEFLWHHLGDLNQKYLHYEEAIFAYNKSLSIEPENAVVLNNLAYTMLAYKQNYPLALEIAKKSVSLSQNSIANRDTLAWAYYKNENYTKALETISILFQNQKEISPEIDFHYAAILNELDLLAKPTETFDKMILKPEVILNRPLVMEIIEVRHNVEKKQKKEK